MSSLSSSVSWRPADEALLERLLDEERVTALFRFYVVGSSSPSSCACPRRAGGLVAELRKIGMVAKEPREIARFIDDLKLREQRPELLHHLALFHGRAATLLAARDPERAAAAWVRSLSAWLALVEEGAYLRALEESVRGASAEPSRAALELVEEVGRRAEAAARDLAPDGRAALLALARTNEAARAADVPEATCLRVRGVADRRRNGAIESALAGIADALDEANVRGDLGAHGKTILLRTLDVWAWASHDVAVEHFLVERLEPVGWELYRARKWAELGVLLAPFRPMFESLARRVVADPSQIAYASAAAQMFVFESEVEDALPRKLAFAERAVEICPTHRNGRLVLATLLCRQASTMLRTMVVFARKDDLARAAALVERAEALYPQTSQLAAVKATLERARKNALL
jgi:hypothetical protein